MQIGVCNYYDIALAMVCPIVAIHNDRNQMVIYGGGIHFSKDRLDENGRLVFGEVAKNNGNT